MWEEKFKVGDFVRIARITGDYDFVRSRTTDKYLGRSGKIISKSNGQFMLYTVDLPEGYLSCKQEWLEPSETSKLNVTSDDLMELLE